MDGEWVGTVETEGNVTTVRNDSGSVWGGTATLVEELSIGVEQGDEPYLFGSVAAISAHEDRIFVLDSQVPTVRVYDLDGTHLLDIGRAGEGPGELGGGFDGPIGFATDEGGRLYVHVRSKIEVLSRDGKHLDTWGIDGGRAFGPVTIVATGVGSVLLPQFFSSEERLPWRRDIGLQAIQEGDPAGELRPLPDLEYRTPYLEQAMGRAGAVSGMIGIIPPFVPTLVWNVDSAGEILIGRADRYEIQRHRTDSTRLIVSKFWDPVPVQHDELAWYERRVRLQVQREDAVGPPRGYDLDAGLPTHKPAFEQFIPTRDGGTWVVRAGPGERLPDCAEGALDVREMSANPCWRDTYILDVFDADGRYLGDVPVPEIFYNKRGRKFDPQPFIEGDTMLAVVEDELGTIMVKRYRLVTPAEEG